MKRSILWTLALSVGIAVEAAACPMCSRGVAESAGQSQGNSALGVAVAGGLLLAAPITIAGIFALLLGRTMSSAGAGLLFEEPAVKEPQ